MSIDPERGDLVPKIPESPPSLIREVAAEKFDEEVIERSRQAPILVYFGGDWCIDCKRLIESQVLEEAAKRYGIDVVHIEINGNNFEQTEVEDLRTKYSIRSYPTLMFFDRGETQAYLHPSRHPEDVNCQITTKDLPRRSVPMEDYTPGIFRSTASLIVDALMGAENEGRREVTVFDFGCGKVTMFRELLTTADSQTLQFLRTHPTIKLRLLGLTHTTGIEREAKDPSHLTHFTSFTQVPSGQVGFNISPCRVLTSLLL